MAEFRIGRLKFNWRGAWVASTEYLIDDIVKFGSNTYVCTQNHTSVSSEENWYTTDAAGKWSLHTEGITHRGEWQSNTYYKPNDIIKYGNTQYRVTDAFSSVGFSTSNLEEYLQSFNYEDTWDSATEYQVGDVVAYGGYTYVSTKTNTDSIPPYNLTEDWDIQTTGFNVLGEYSASANYIQGDVVQYGGNTYVAITTSVNTVPTTIANWKTVAKGFNWRGTWGAGTQYQLGDVVKRQSNSYVGVNTGGSLGQDPATDSTNTYWDNLVEGAANNVMTTSGDLTYYTTGATRLPAGTNGQVLVIDKSTGLPAWEDNSITHPVYYVSEEGDDTNSGENLSRSFASIKHACGIATGPATIYVKAGTYEETLPIVVPPLVSIVGDNIRTSKVKPKTGDAHYQVLTLNTSPSGTHNVSNASYDPIGGDLELTIGSHLYTDRDSINLADNSLKFTCNFNGDGQVTEKTYPRASGATGGQTFNTGKDYVQGQDIPIKSVTATTITINVNGGHGAITDVTYHQFVSATGGAVTKAKPYVSYGSSISNGAGDKWASILTSSYDEKTVHIRPVSGGLWSTGDTWEDGISDITITDVDTRANAESVMFFLSDKTMLKDLLMTDMSGFAKAGLAATITASIDGSVVTGTNFYPDLVGTTVTGAGVSIGTKVSGFTNDTTIEVDVKQVLASTDLTFTAQESDPNNATIKGVFVQLNPESAIEKSPYISNCSATSITGIGAIVDGEHHRQFKDNINPSNKSIVFDSFTNIHDNGMAFWVTGGAAAEMVSCFTYYNWISYAATRGGRIRSLAGNSSWGTYGVVSSGFSPLEKAREGTLEGLVLGYDDSTRVGTGFEKGERVRGSTSEALGLINAVQGTAQENLYYSLISEGPAGIGTGFVQGETITGQTSGTTATLLPNTSANRGQSGFTLVCAGLSTTPTLEENGSIEFVTGIGNGGLNSELISGADPFTFLITGVSIDGADGRGNVNIDRAKLASTGAAHTGGTTEFINYPLMGNSTTTLTPTGASDTTINVASITGFAANQFALLGDELVKIDSLPSSTSMLVTREQEGAGAAASYNIGQSVVSIGSSQMLNQAECFKDFTGVATNFRAVNPNKFWDGVNAYTKVDDEFIQVTGVSTDPHGLATLTLVEEKAAKGYDNQDIKIRYIYSQARLTGHDFLQVGTGGTVTTNWPGVPAQDPIQANEITEGFPGRVFYVSTDQDGNFRVGKYFRVNQATGAATLNANTFDLSGLTELRLGSIGAQLGASINEFSTDGALSQNSNSKVPTQAAVRTFVGVQTTGALADAVRRADAGIATALTDSRTYTYFAGGFAI